MPVTACPIYLHLCGSIHFELLVLERRQKDQLAGIENQVLKTLWMVLMCYFIFFHILCFLVVVLWIWLTPVFGQSVMVDGVKTFRWELFTAGSSFKVLGYTLTPDTMVSFKNAAFPST